MDARITLGRALFQSLSEIYDLPPHNDHIAYPIVQAQTIHQVEASIFALKMYTCVDSSSTKILQGIFQDLADHSLSERIQKWCSEKDIRSKPSYHPSLIRQFRECIGKRALEVFFEAILDRNKKALWEYFSRPENRIGQMKPLPSLIFPASLCAFLTYLACCNENTKHAHKGNIRKFIKSACDEPLAIDDVRMSISNWTKDARQILANALVANGMYEECVEYDLPEAILPLKLKFLGAACTETDDGLIALSHTGKTTAIETAMWRACSDREWRHIWSALSVLEFKHGTAHLLGIVDPTALSPRDHGDQTDISLKLAFVFQNGFKDGLQGL